MKILSFWRTQQQPICPQEPGAPVRPWCSPPDWASILSVEGQYWEAEKQWDKAISVYQSLFAFSDDELVAVCVLARSLLEQGRLADAQAAIESGSTLATKSQNRGVSLRFAITAARVSAAAGKVELARSSLAGALEEATKKSYLGYQLEARLALGKIEMKSGKEGLGRERLRQLARDAKSKGFELIARDALAAAKAELFN